MKLYRTSDPDEYKFDFLTEPVVITDQKWDQDIIPIVSTSTLTYNHEPYIRDCIEGLLSQKTTFPVRLVIFDDCSTDGTREIVKEYEDRYPQLIIGIYPAENTYRKPSRKEAMIPRDEARNIAKYIAFCEGDDYWTDPLKLQKQFEFMEQNKEYSLIWTDVVKLNQKTGVITDGMLKDKPVKNTREDFLLNAWFIATCTWFFNSRILRDLNNYPHRHNYSVGDLKLLLIATDYGEITKYPSNSTTAVYRVLEESASHFKSIKQHITFRKGVLAIQMDYSKYFNAGFRLKIKIIFAYVNEIISVVKGEVKKNFKSIFKYQISSKETELEYRGKSPS